MKLENGPRFVAGELFPPPLEGPVACIAIQITKNSSHDREPPRKTISVLSAATIESLYDKMADLRLQDGQSQDATYLETETSFGDIFEIAAYHPLVADRIDAKITQRQHQLKRELDEAFRPTLHESFQYRHGLSSLHQKNS